MKTDRAWVAADRAADLYYANYANYGMRNSKTVRMDNARSSMTISGPNRLIKVKPLLDDPTDTYAPGQGIPQWRVSEAAATRGTLQGRLLFPVQPGERYPA